MNEPPQVVIIAGPNGAGKSTCAVQLVPSGTTFINADEIAKELPAGGGRNRDMEAGRILLRRLDELAHQRADFAVETTLASRSLAPRLARLRNSGYEFSLFFIWAPSPDLSVARVAARVRRGGHNIPEEVIRRRYVAGLRNLFELYRPLADVWRVYRNVQPGEPVLVAEGAMGKRTQVADALLWTRIKRQARRAKENEND